MKIAVLLLVCLLTGCATNADYSLYLEAQKSLSRDATVVEAGRISALVELSKTHPDPTVRLAAINALVQLQERSKPVTVEQPKKNFLFF